MTMPTPSEDAKDFIDSGIRTYLLQSPHVLQSIRATLRHAIIAQVFEASRAIRIPRLLEVLRGAEPFADEEALINELKIFIQQHSQGPSDERLRELIRECILQETSNLKIVHNS